MYDKRIAILTSFTSFKLQAKASLEWEEYDLKSLLKHSNSKLSSLKRWFALEEGEDGGVLSNTGEGGGDDITGGGSSSFTEETGDKVREGKGAKRGTPTNPSLKDLW